MEYAKPPIDDPFFLGLYRHWDAKRGNRPYPTWPEFDPLELKPWLGSINVIDVESGTGRYKFRLFGQNAASLLNVEMTGRYADELPNYIVDSILKDYDTVVAASVPVSRVHQVGAGTLSLTVRRLIMPLSARGDALDMILSAMRVE